MSVTAGMMTSRSVPDEGLRSADLEIPACDRGIGSVIATVDSEHLLDGVRVAAMTMWPDDRGYFLEVHRASAGLIEGYEPGRTQTSATVTYPGIVKAFHHHLLQYDCWTVVAGMVQIALIDLRRESPTFGLKNTLYVGDLRPWQVLIPPGIAHGYKVLGTAAGVLVYATSRFYNPSDEYRIPYDDSRLSYDWETQFK